jgi:hypothetical protein
VLSVIKSSLCLNFICVRRRMVSGVRILTASIALCAMWLLIGNHETTNIMWKIETV